MTDLSERQSSMSTKIVGAGADNLETYYAGVTAANEVKTVGTTVIQSLAEQGKGFTAHTEPISITGSSETDFLLIRNPVSSGVVVKFDFIIYGYLVAASGQFTRYIFYRSPTITADGSSLTIHKLKSDQATSSSISMFTAPTISARGTDYFEEYAIQPATRRDYGLTFTIAENEDVLVTAVPGTANKEHMILMTWVEDDS